MSNPVPSAAHLTRRGLITFALVWQGLWMLSDSQLWPTSQTTELESVLILGTWVLWVLMLALLVNWLPGSWKERWLVRLAGMNVVLLALGAVSMSLLSIDPRINDWLISASIFNLAIGLAGIVIYQPRQWIWVFALFGIEMTIFIGFGFSYAGEMTIVSVIMYPLYSLAIGIAAATVQRGLMNGASEYDSMRDAVIEQQAIAQQHQDAEREISLMQSRIHESVLNTLTAIARGGIPETHNYETLIRQRAVESAEVLTELAKLPQNQSVTKWTGFTESISDLVGELTARGIKVKIDGRSDSQPPHHIEGAVIAGVRESLINVLRHSDASEVVIKVGGHRLGDFNVIIEDNGIGFEHDRFGFGLGSILTTQLSEVGAISRIESTVGKGTSVTIEYVQSSQLKRFVNSLTWNFKQPSFSLVAPILGSWLLYSLAIILFTWNSYESQLLNVLSFSILLGASLLTIWLSRSGGIPWWQVLVGVIAAYAAYQLEYQAVGEGFGEPWTEWSSELIAALFFVFAVAGPWWAWIFLGLSWVYIQGNFPMEFIAPGFAMLMTGAFLGWTIRKNSRRLSRSMREAYEAASQTSIAQTQSRFRYERFSYLDAEATIDLLVKIADGSVDWRDKGIKRLCSVHEAYVRNIAMGKSPHSIELISGFARLARDRGIVLETSVTDLGEKSSVNPNLNDQVYRLLERVHFLESSRLTISRENGNTIARLVGQLSPDWHGDPHNIVSAGTFEIETDAMGAKTFVWQSASAARTQ